MGVCDGVGEVGVAGMDVLDQAVLDAVGRDEHHAGHVPRARCPSAVRIGLGAGRGDALDVVDEVDRAAAEGRPGAAVDRPVAARGRPRAGASRPRFGGITPPAMATPLISDAADRSAGRSRAASCGRPRSSAAARWARGSSGTRPASAGVAPGLCSRMSNTPWPAGSTPVRKVGHAAQECDGMHERDDAAAGRAAISAARLGRSPGLEHRVEDLPVGAVPADDEYSVGHGGQDTGGR